MRGGCEFRAHERRNFGFLCGVSCHFDRHLTQALIAHNLPANQKCVARGQGGRKSLFDFAQRLSASRALQAHFECIGILYGANVHADLTCRTRVAQLPQPVGSLHKSLPLVIGAQRITPRRTKFEAGIERVSVQVRICTDRRDFIIESICVERASTGRDQHMLAQHVPRPRALCLAIERAGDDCVQCRTAFHHFEAIGRDQQRFGGGVVAMIGPPDALHQTFDVFGRSDLYHQIHVAPVDAKVEAARADNCAQVATNHRSFDLLALLPVKRAMMDADRQAFLVGKPQIMKENLCLRARIVEDQRCFVRFDLLEHCGYRISGIAT